MSRASDTVGASRSSKLAQCRHRAARSTIWPTAASGGSYWLPRLSCFGDSYTFHPWVLPIRIRVAAPFSWPELIDVGAPPARSRVLRAQDRRLIGDLPDLTKAMADANVDFTSGLSGLGHACFNDRSTQAYDEASAPTAGSDR
jgi:hypothetical protein